MDDSVAKAREDVLIDLLAQGLAVLKDAHDTVRKCSLERARLIEERDLLYDQLATLTGKLEDMRRGGDL